jgi:folate-dependent phosphoribosylglycinamide formyltransferase PurN
MENKKIILLGGHGESTKIMFNALDTIFRVDAAIIEDKEPLKLFLKRRIKRLGLLKVIGQIAFQLTIPKILSIFSQKRIEEIIKDNNLDSNDIPTDKLKLVSSINAKSTIELIKAINPDLIIVNGTRIISKKVLQAVNCKFINAHAGITPMYRGVHGTYWALVNRDIENSGVTVHFIDEGIDTGNIIKQRQVIPTSKDNFITYPVLQLAFGIELLIPSIKDFFIGDIPISKEKGESKLYYHPTIWEYLYYRVVRKVK